MSSELHPNIANVCDHFAAYMLAEWSAPFDDFDQIVSKHAPHLIPYLVQKMRETENVPRCFEPDDECIAMMVERIITAYGELYAQSFVSAETM
jgi:hypothetical protein